jgi:cytochrome c5
MWPIDEVLGWAVIATAAIVILTGCSDGADSTALPAAPEKASAQERATWGGAQIYDEVCDRCHKMGVDGAPELDDIAAWEPRLAKGRDTLLNHVHDGFKEMPPRGDCEFCSDAQLAEALEYMIGQVR